MMNTTTVTFSSRFGTVEADPNSFLRFVRPLLGFEDLQQFALLNLDEYRPLYWLQSTEEAGLALPLLEPGEVDGDYHQRVLEASGWKDRGELEVLCIVSRQDGQWGVNLVAPLVVDSRTAEAQQVVLKDTPYDTFHPLATTACW
jgi:flagellar assembly factor FliW